MSQTEEPSLDLLPGAHGRQSVSNGVPSAAEVLPVKLFCVPTGQFIHSFFPTSYLPGWHSLQTEEPTTDMLPGAHGRQPEVLPVKLLYVPTVAASRGEPHDRRTKQGKTNTNRPHKVRIDVPLPNFETCPSCRGCTQCYPLRRYIYPLGI